MLSLLFYDFAVEKSSTIVNAKVLSSAPKHKKAVMHLMKKTCMLDRFHSGRSYSAVGQEFNVNESIKYIK